MFCSINLLFDQCSFDESTPTRLSLVGAEPEFVSKRLYVFDALLEPRELLFRNASVYTLYTLGNPFVGKRRKTATFAMTCCMKLVH